MKVNLISTSAVRPKDLTKAQVNEALDAVKGIDKLLPERTIRGKVKGSIPAFRKAILANYAKEDGRITAAGIKRVYKRMAQLYHYAANGIDPSVNVVKSFKDASEGEQNLIDLATRAASPQLGTYLGRIYEGQVAQDETPKTDSPVGKPVQVGTGGSKPTRIGTGGNLVLKRKKSRWSGELEHVLEYTDGAGNVDRWLITPDAKKPKYSHYASFNESFASTKRKFDNAVKRWGISPSTKEYIDEYALGNIKPTELSRYLKTQAKDTAVPKHPSGNGGQGSGTRPVRGGGTGNPMDKINVVQPKGYTPLGGGGTTKGTKGLVISHQKSLSDVTRWLIREESSDAPTFHRMHENGTLVNYTYETFKKTLKRWGAPVEFFEAIDAYVSGKKSALTVVKRANALKTRAPASDPNWKPEPKVRPTNDAPVASPKGIRNPTGGVKVFRPDSTDISLVSSKVTRNGTWGGSIVLQGNKGIKHTYKYANAQTPNKIAVDGSKFRVMIKGKKATMKQFVAHLEKDHGIKLNATLQKKMAQAKPNSSASFPRTTVKSADNKRFNTMIDRVTKLPLADRATKANPYGRKAVVTMFSELDLSPQQATSLMNAVKANIAGKELSGPNRKILATIRASTKHAATTKKMLTTIKAAVKENAKKK